MKEDHASSAVMDERAEAERGDSGDLGSGLVKLLARGSSVDELDREIEQLAVTQGDRVHAELLFLLAHLSFEPDEARLHSRRIVMLDRSLADGLPP